MTLLSPFGYAWRRGKQGLQMLRGKYILRRYTAHYRRAQRVYGHNGHASKAARGSIGDVGVLVARPNLQDNPIALPPSHAAAVDRVAKSVAAALERSANCRFFPPPPSPLLLAERTMDAAQVVNGDVIAIQLLEPLVIDGLHELCEPLLRQVEQTIYRSHTIVDKVYVYRSPISRQIPRTSWRWHFDNHPREMLKVMVYLTDVNEGTAPFEYVRETSTGRPLLGTPLAPRFGTSRVPPEEVDRKIAGGWVIDAVTGSRGTVIVFDDNIVHRATLGKTGYRDVVVFQIRPAAFKAAPRIDSRWTGTFGHQAMNSDPNDLVQHRVW